MERKKYFSIEEVPGIYTGKEFPKKTKNAGKRGVLPYKSKNGAPCLINRTRRNRKISKKLFLTFFRHSEEEGYFAVFLHGKNHISAFTI